MNRGRRGESVFREKQDYVVFVELLKEVVDLYKVRVAAYCLIPNHLLVQTPDGDLARYMRHPINNRGFHLRQEIERR